MRIAHCAYYNVHVADFPQPRQKYIGTGENIVIAENFYPVDKTF